MTSIRERALSAFYAAVQTAGLGAAARFPMGVSENVILDAASVQGFVQLDGGDELAGDQLAGQLMLETRVAVILTVASATWPGVSPALSAARAAVRNALAAEPTLGGLVLYVRYEGTELPDRPGDDSGKPLGLCVLHYVLQGAEAELDANALE